MKTSVALSFLFLTVACSSSKVLDEARAQEQIEDSLQNESFMISVADNIGPLMYRTAIDYSATKATDGPAATMQLLLDEGLIQQVSMTESYVDVSGLWNYEKSYTYGSTKSHDTYAIQLEMVANRWPIALTGTCSFKSSFENLGGSGDYSNSGALSGSMTPEGFMALSGIRGCFGDKQPVRYAYRVESGVAYLDPDIDGYREYTKMAATRKVDVNWYTYSFSPDVSTISRESGEEVSAGQYEIGPVTDLILATETHAVARFAWKVALNKIGKVLVGDMPSSGFGIAEFLKKPDGSWVLVKKVSFSE